MFRQRGVMHSHPVRHEYFAGTSYTNPASLLIFEAITRDSSNGVVVTWQGVAKGQGSTSGTEYTDQTNENDDTDYQCGQERRT